MATAAVPTVLLALVAPTLLMFVGCDETPTAAPPPALRSPEQVFDEIVESVKEAMENSQNRGMILFDANSGSRGTVRYTVTGKLVPPPDAATPLRGKVSIVVRSHFVSGQTPEPTEDEPEPEDDLGLPAGVELAEGVDPELFAPKPRPRANEKPPIDTDKRTHELREESSYLLEYQNGKWQLVSELDPKVESALQMAFDRAIDRQ